MVGIEPDRLSDFPDIALVFDNLFDGFEFKLWRKCMFGTTSFEHAIT